MEKLTLAEVTKALKEAEQAQARAQEIAEVAAVLVATVRSEESRDKIMNLLSQISEYTPEIKHFDKDLQKEVKSELRKIVKSTFGDNFRITRISKEGNKTNINYSDAETIAVLKDNGAVDESTGMTRNRIQTIVSINSINKADGVFSHNAWSGRDKKIIKDSKNKKNMVYWVDDKE
tara:strand:+ start:1257 stop:1784 length:528 start_codon:yes stop_codon:yes gene_type:complete